MNFSKKINMPVTISSIVTGVFHSYSSEKNILPISKQIVPAKWNITPNMPKRRVTNGFTAVS